MTPPILGFQGRYRFLSNFYFVNVRYDNELYHTVEHAYQAAKTLDTEQRKKIQYSDFARDAKRLGRKVTIRKDWEEIKIPIMRELLLQKFAQEPFKSQLIATVNRELIENNLHRDHFWGVCRGQGQNMLGRLLMEVRYYLRFGVKAWEVQHYEITLDPSNEYHFTNPSQVDVCVDVVLSKVKDDDRVLLEE